MKKALVSLAVLITFIGLTTFCFAQQTKTTGSKAEVFKGKIVSIDSGKNEVVVKAHKAGERTIVVDPTVISSLKVDEEVKITLKPGSNIAETVVKIAQKTEHKKHKK